MLLLPSTAFAATNLPPSDAHLSKKPQENATYSRPSDYFLRLDWARRIGLPKDVSYAAQARNRL